MPQPPQLSTVVAQWLRWLRVAYGTVCRAGRATCGDYRLDLDRLAAGEMAIEYLARFFVLPCGFVTDGLPASSFAI